MKSNSVIPILALALSALATAPAEAKQKDAIRVQIGGEPSTLDPWRAIDTYAFGILRNVVEGLFVLDSRGELQNGLAASYEISKDALSYKFHLRENAKWSDGPPVKPADVVFGLRHALDPKTGAPNAEYFFAIKNAREVFAGKLPPERLGVRAEGGDVIIDLAKPDPLLLLELTLPAAAPLREDAFRLNKNRWDIQLPVTGAYRIVKYQPSDEVDLEPNPFARRPAKKKITYKILTEELTAMNLFESERLDVISTVTMSEAARLQAEGLVRTVPSTTTFYLSFNTGAGQFRDLEWRRAIAGSVDRAGLAKLLKGSFESAESYLPKSIAGAIGNAPLPKLDAHAFELNLQAAAKLRAGSAKKPRIRFAYGASAFTKVVAEKLQNDLKKNLGVDLELQPMELKTLLGRLRSDPPEMYLLGMSAAFNDPVTQLNAFSSATVPNFSRYVSPVYEKVLEDLKVAPIGPVRAAKAEEANRLLVEKDVVVIPLVLRLQVYGVSKKLKGFSLSPYQVIDLGQLTK